MTPKKLFPIQKLPTDIIQEVSKHLSPRDRFILLSSGKAWSNVALEMMPKPTKCQLTVKHVGKRVSFILKIFSKNGTLLWNIRIYPREFWGMQRVPHLDGIEVKTCDGFDYKKRGCFHFAICGNQQNEQDVKTFLRWLLATLRINLTDVVFRRNPRCLPVLNLLTWNEIVKANNLLVSTAPSVSETLTLVETRKSFGKETHIQVACFDHWTPGTHSPLLCMPIKILIIKQNLCPVTDLYEAIKYRINCQNEETHLLRVDSELNEQLLQDIHTQFNLMPAPLSISSTHTPPTPREYTPKLSLDEQIAVIEETMHQDSFWVFSFTKRSDNTVDFSMVLYKRRGMTRNTEYDF